MEPSRRRLFTWGLGGSALLAIGSLGLALQPGHIGTPPADLQVLDAKAWTIVAAVADVLAPPSGPPAAAIDVATRVDQQLGRMHPADAAELLLALKLLENGFVGMFFGGGFRPFTQSTLEQRRAVLEGWRLSPIADLAKAFKAIRGLVITSYYSHPRAYVASGYPGPPDFGQAGAPAVQLPQAPEPPATGLEGVPG